MTNQEIFEKAQEKAIKNGWVGLHCDELSITHSGSTYDTALLISKIYYNMIIFSHDFAKAFWGDGRLICLGCHNGFDNYEEFSSHDKQFNCSTSYGYNHTLNWKQHLQQMVLEKEPLKYLEKFL